VYKVCISETTNDIAFIGNTPNRLYFYTGNCDPIGEKDLASDLRTPEQQQHISNSSSSSTNNNVFMKSLCFSNATEGLNVNVIAVGLSNGKINLYSTWDLTLLREVTFNYDASTTIGCIISLAYSKDCKRLYVSDTYARVYILETYSSASAVSKMQSQMLLSSSNISNINNYLPNYASNFSCFT
jgi:hypothetical protein